MKYSPTSMFVKILVLLLTISPLYLKAQDVIKVPSGTSVVVRPTEPLSPRNYRTGDAVQFKVVADVLVEDKIVIASGASSQGTVSLSKEPGIIGAPAKISISVDSVQTVDGSAVPVRATKHQEGEDKQTNTLILGLICLPLILTEGGDTQIPQGTTIEAYTIGTIEVTLK